MTIVEKLKLNKYNNLAVINQPSDYKVFSNRMSTFTKDHDCIFIFIETIDEMVQHTRFILEDEQLLLEKGYLFFAYPKKGNRRYQTFVHRDEIFPAMDVGEDGYVGNSDLKFNRMVSMDDVFTVVGLKREPLKVQKTLAASQCVGDYQEKVSDVETLLVEHPVELKFYQSLTSGYRRDWARYIFSAKQKQTREKRYLQMVDILSQEYKSIDLYRQKKK